MNASLTRHKFNVPLRSLYCTNYCKTGLIMDILKTFEKSEVSSAKFYIGINRSKSKVCK